MTTKHSLCVGINYVGTGSELSGCVNDANDWRALLIDRGYAVTDLIEQDATKENILAALTKLVQATKFGDTSIFTYSGHGTYVADQDGDELDGRDEALCPVDVFDGEIVTDDELYDIFNDRHHGARVIFISDSCHSGTVARFVTSGAVDEFAPKVRFLPPGDFLPKKLRPLGRGIRPIMPTRSTAALISGCRDFEYSYDAYINGRWNGAMSRMALDSLEGLSGEPTLKQWHAEIRKRLPTQSWPQQPQLVGTSSQKKWKI